MIQHLIQELIHSSLWKTAPTFHVPMSIVNIFLKFPLLPFCFHPRTLLSLPSTGLFIFSPPFLFPLLSQLFSRMPSTCSIIILVVDKASLFSTQTQNCFPKTVCICSLFQSTSVLKFPLLTVFMWFFSYRNDYCQVSGERSCATAPFSACVTRTS